MWFVQNLQKFAPDHALVKFLPALEKVNGSPSHAGLETLPNLIKTLGDDPLYLRATWEAIEHFYWNPAVEKAAYLQLQKAVTIGQMYDIGLNMGDLSLVAKVQSSPPSRGGSESLWLADLQSLWYKQITQVDRTLDEGQPDRANMWKSLASNPDLVRPISVQCYGDSFVIA